MALQQTKSDTTQRDRRSPLAKARDKWLESDEGQVCLQTNILSHPNQQQFLRNRLVAAFISGAMAGEKISKGKTHEQK